MEQLYQNIDRYKSSITMNNPRLGMGLSEDFSSAVIRNLERYIVGQWFSTLRILSIGFLLYTKEKVSPSNKPLSLSFK
jgi:hypothetical protein